MKWYFIGLILELLELLVVPRPLQLIVFVRSVTMAVQGIRFSSIPRAILLQTHNPVAQLKQINRVELCILSRRQLTRSFWSLPFCDKFRCGELWSKQRSCIKMEGVGNASSNTSRAGSSGVEQRFTRHYNFETIVLEPKGEHLATIVWLHGFSDSGARWAKELKNMEGLSPNIKWIIPTAPLARDIPVTAWFELRYGQDVDMEGLNRSAETVANLLRNEKTEDRGSKNVKLAVGGFSQGCATALYITACSVLGKYGGTGKPFPVKLDAAIGLSGWMPTTKDFVSRMAGNRDASERAGKTSIFIGHCDDDGVVPARSAKTSSDAFRGVGFNDVTLKTYVNGGHSATNEEIADIQEWITTKLGLEKSRIPAQ